MIYPGLEAVAYFPGTFHEYEILFPGHSTMYEVHSGMSKGIVEVPGKTALNLSYFNTIASFTEL